MLKHLENEENFKDEIKTGTVLVDFFAAWCGPCKMLGVVLEGYAKEHDDITILKVDVDNNQSIAREYGIMSVPTLVLFKDGKLINKEIGFMNKDELADFLK